VEAYRVTEFEDHLLLLFGTTPREDLLGVIQGLAAELNRLPPPGLLEAVAGLTSLALYFDPAETAGPPLLAYLSGLRPRPLEAGRTHRLAVCYAPPHSPDLPWVADYLGLSPAQLVELHQSSLHRVDLIGFLPGFAYLSGWPAPQPVPRLPRPRTEVTSGSVGVAGMQTGLYPGRSPGGWRIIGRTPQRLLWLDREQPGLLQPGDRVQMVAISADAFERQC
jgi:inhibitor of KinA